MAVYTVFIPNSFPINKNPKIHNMIFINMVSIDTGKGTKWERTIATPAMLPTVTLLGIIKKNTAIATIVMAKVITR